MKDFQVVSSLVQLKALVAGLYGRIDALAPVPAPTVDFAVDMFDREDQDTLGGYWSSPDWAIRDGRAVRGGDIGPTTMIAADGLRVLGGSSVTRQANVVGGGVLSLRACVYAADITNPDFTAEIVFYASNSVYDGAGTINPNPSGPYIFLDGIDYYFGSTSAPRTVANGAGVAVANSNNTAEGIAISTWRAPGVIVHSGRAQAVLDSVPAAVLRRGTSIAVNTISPVGEETRQAEATDPGLATHRATHPSASYSVPIVLGGNNVARVVCAGDTAQFSVNGMVVFTGILTTVSRKSRTRAALIDFAGSILAAVVANPWGEFGGINSFKVWRNDTPEPPNETGHGTYTNGRWQYTDKYHTPVTDATGTVIRNEDGTVASYVYDPEA